jgi:hypothetical protein
VSVPGIGALEAAFQAAGTATVEAAAFAGGLAISPVLRPVLQAIENATWSEYPDKPLDAATAAEVAAENYAAYGDMETEATHTGYGTDRFAHLYDVTVTAPGEGTLLQLLRRSSEVGIDFEHGLRKAKLEGQWDAALRNLADARLNPAAVALAVVRSIMQNDGLQVGTLDSSGGVVPAYPVSSIDPVVEASLSGIDEERLRVMVGSVGLPASPIQAALMYFRGIIDQSDVWKAVQQSDTRPAWGPFLQEFARQILTAEQYLEGALRGWISYTDGVAGAAKHGMSPTDAQLLYQIRRRPLTPHTISQALARGGTFDTAQAPFADPYVSSVHEADLGPEWYGLAEAMKYSPPSLFVIRQLLKDGVYTQDHAALRIRQLGIYPEDADLIAAAYAPAPGAAADPHVTKAENQLWTATHRAYLNGHAPAATLTPAFTALGITPAAQQTVLDLWTLEQQLERFGLTAANIHKAYTKGDTNDATGQPWTRDDAIAELVKLGYNQSEAGQYLDIP